MVSSTPKNLIVRQIIPTKEKRNLYDGTKINVDFYRQNFFVSLIYKMDTCDPNAEIADLRKLIKMNTGHSIKLTREQICQVYDDIQGGKLPLPPLVLDSKMSYLIDKKSPLTPKDFDVLFDSSSKRTDLKRIARKVGLVKTEQMTKNQIFDAIGKRLRYMNVHEPIKISRKRLLSSKSNTAANNAAVNNLGLNNAAANNAAANNLGLNNTGNSGNNLGLNNGNRVNNWNRIQVLTTLVIM